MPSRLCGTTRGKPRLHRNRSGRPKPQRRKGRRKHPSSQSNHSPRCRIGDHETAASGPIVPTVWLVAVAGVAGTGTLPLIPGTYLRERLCHHIYNTCGDPPKIYSIDRQQQGGVGSSLPSRRAQSGPAKAPVVPTANPLGAAKGLTAAWGGNGWGVESARGKGLPSTVAPGTFPAPTGGTVVSSTADEVSSVAPTAKASTAAPRGNAWSRGSSAIINAAKPPLQTAHVTVVPPPTAVVQLSGELRFVLSTVFFSKNPLDHIGE